MGLRQTARETLEFGLLSTGLHHLLARRLRGGALVLAYHNIRPDRAAPEGDRSLHLPLESFRRQLDLLHRNHRVVPLADLVAPDPVPEAGARIAITFDDAYRGALSLGIAALAERGLPATVFVTPGCLGGHTFWWDALAGADGLADAIRLRALDDLRGDDAAIRDWAVSGGLPARDPAEDCRSASESELSAAAGTSGITLAAHTWSHPNLARVAKAHLSAELERPLSWLRERFTNVRPWLAYPYGRWSPAVARAARAAGYEAAFRVEGGWHRSGEGDPFALPRLNVPAGLTAAGFELRLAGLRCR